MTILILYLLCALSLIRICESVTKSWIVEAEEAYLKKIETTTNDVYKDAFCNIEDYDYEKLCSHCLGNSQFISEAGMIFRETDYPKTDPCIKKTIRLDALLINKEKQLIRDKFGKTRLPEKFKKSVKIEDIPKPTPKYREENLVKCPIHKKNGETGLVYVDNGLHTTADNLSCFVFAEPNDVKQITDIPSTSEDAEISNEVIVVTHGIDPEIKNLEVVFDLEESTITDNATEGLVKSAVEAANAFLNIYSDSDESDEDYCKISSEDVCGKCLSNSNILRENHVRPDQNPKSKSDERCVTKNVKIIEKFEESDVKIVEGLGKKKTDYWKKREEANKDFQKRDGKTKMNYTQNTNEKRMKTSKSEGKEKMKLHKSEDMTNTKVSDKDGKNKTYMTTSKKVKDMDSLDQNGQKKVNLTENKEETEFNKLKKSNEEHYTYSEGNEKLGINLSEGHGKSKSNCYEESDKSSVIISETPDKKKMKINTNGEKTNITNKVVNGKTKMKLDESSNTGNVKYVEKGNEKKMKSSDTKKNSKAITKTNSDGKLKADVLQNTETINTDVLDKPGHRKTDQKTTKEENRVDLLKTKDEKIKKTYVKENLENVNVTEKEGGQKETKISKKGSEKNKEETKNYKKGVKTVKQKLVPCRIMEDLPDGVQKSDTVYILERPKNESSNSSSCFVFAEPNYVLPNDRKKKKLRKNKEKPESEDVKVLLHVTSDDEDSSSDSSSDSDDDNELVVRLKGKRYGKSPKKSDPGKSSAN